MLLSVYTLFLYLYGLPLISGIKITPFFFLNNSLKLKTISVNNVYYANGISYYKYDGIGNKKVKVEALINQTLPANAEYPINNIPSSLKPDIDIQFVVITTLGNSCTVVLKPDGILYLKPNVNLTADEGIYTDFLDFVI